MRKLDARVETWAIHLQCLVAEFQPMITVVFYRTGLHGMNEPTNHCWIGFSCNSYVLYCSSDFLVICLKSVSLHVRGCQLRLEGGTHHCTRCCFGVNPNDTFFKFLVSPQKPCGWKSGFLNVLFTIDSVFYPTCLTLLHLECFTYFFFSFFKFSFFSFICFV